MVRADVRPIVGLRSTAGTGTTGDDRCDDPDPFVLREYEPAVRGHVEFREER